MKSKHSKDNIAEQRAREPPSIEVLKFIAENEFHSEFHRRPTYAACAPGCLNITGEVSNFNDGKALCMAIQLAVVVVGTRRSKSKWCRVKTLSNEVEEETFFKFYLNSKGLDTAKEPSWINYVKGAIKSYKVKRELIPGFNVVIISSIPIKTGLGSSTALTTAIYTFLEAITDVYTINTFEKAIACKLAKKLATSDSNFVGETLASVVGFGEEIMEIDTRTLQVTGHKWNPENVEWIFIQLPGNKTTGSDYAKCLVKCREIAFALNKTSFRDVTIEELAELEPFFSDTYINAAKHIIHETSRVNRIVDFIQKNLWKKLGETLWEGYYSAKNVTFYSSDVENIMDVLKNTRGVLGAKVIGHKRIAGRILILVQKQFVQEIISTLTNMNIQEVHILRPEPGGKILYKGDKVPLKAKSCSEHAKIAAKYHLKGKESFTNYYARLSKDRDSATSILEIKNNDSESALFDFTAEY